MDIMNGQSILIDWRTNERTIQIRIDPVCGCRFDWKFIDKIVSVVGSGAVGNEVLSKLESGKCGNGEKSTKDKHQWGKHYQNKRAEIKNGSWANMPNKMFQTRQRQREKPT